MLELRKKLRKLKRKELTPEVLATEHKKSYGLFLLHENALPDDSKDYIGVDVVAIYDLLPSALPGSRVFTYGYPSELFWSNSVATLRDYSGNLLSSLGAVWEGRQRPIIFVCYSLGGIVCKQALVMAHKNDRLHGNILSAVSAIVFFGTPHRSSRGADIRKAIARVINICMRVPGITGIVRSIRDDLLTTLESNSRALNDLAISSQNRLRDLEIVTFYETQTIPRLSKLVVPQTSAILEIPCEDVISLYANYRTMCRFGGAADSNYSQVLNVMKRLAKTALLNREMTMTVDRTSSNYETERSCMVLLNSIYLVEYKAQLPTPVQGTCSWVLTHPAYLTWLKTEETKLLWITGEPGCGKTMLSAYITDHLRLDHATSVKPLVFFFFCDDKVKSQRDANAILRGILYQIVQQHRKLIKYVKSRFETDGPSLANSFPALWELFLKIISNSASGAVRVIVDAIDECEVRTRNSFLKAIMQLVNDSQDVYRQSRNCVKFLITSRPSLGNSYDLTGSLKNRLSIEEDQGIVSEDLRLVIRSKVADIAKKFNCDEETRSYLERVLYSKSDQSFLWLNMVLHSLETSLKASRRDFERIIDTFPRSLQATYDGFLSRISIENQEDAGKILRLLVGCSRYLTLVEINTAFTIDQDHESIADVVNDLQHSISTTLQNIVGSFSAKEYLTDLALRSAEKTVKSLAVSLPNAALEISQSCIRYLLLEEFQLDIFALEGTSRGTNSPESYRSFPYTNFDTTAPDNHLGLDNLGLDNHLGLEKHYSLYKDIAPKTVQDAIKELTKSSGYFKNNMEYSFPDVFKTIKVAAFFNLSILLAKILEKAESSLKCMKVLLQHDTNPNRISTNRQTPLTISAQYSHLDTIQILLDEPFTDVTLKGKSRRSALSFTAGNGHLEIVEVLLKHEALRLNDQDNARWTPLFWAVIGDYAKVVQLLLRQSCIYINEVDKHGRSVLSWAAGEGAGRALKDLRNAISWACQGGHTDTLRILLKNNCGGEDDVDVDTWTPLLWALFDRSPATVEVLLSSQRVQIDRQDGYGRTALIWAASYGYLDVVQLLILWKANVLIKNHGGHAAADVARMEGYTEVWEFLEAQQRKELEKSVDE
ncbi:hypothetical protein J3E71DRAFT_377760 [Bipolaris maydis]|nr:hypothetical protein J3E71DRAFT_377760 [Bipolaris maydis]